MLLVCQNCLVRNSDVSKVASFNAKIYENFAKYSIKTKILKNILYYQYQIAYNDTITILARKTV